MRRLLPGCAPMKSNPSHGPRNITQDGQTESARCSVIPTNTQPSCRTLTATLMFAGAGKERRSMGGHGRRPRQLPG
eukprot:5977099-Pyramimonas_sp.AAC.1